MALCWEMEKNKKVRQLEATLDLPGQTQKKITYNIILICILNTRYRFPQIREKFQPKCDASLG